MTFELPFSDVPFTWFPAFGLENSSQTTAFNLYVMDSVSLVTVVILAGILPDVVLFFSQENQKCKRGQRCDTCRNLVECDKFDEVLHANFPWISAMHRTFPR